MNKKFSTLMAGLMLASAFSVASAHDLTGKYENGKYYMLAIGNDTGDAADKVLSVNSSTNGTYGQLSLVDASTVGDLETTRNALWQVTVIKEKAGDTPTYRFVNVATGQFLSVATPTVWNSTSNEYNAVTNVTITGSFMEWYNGLNSTGIEDGSPLMSYVKDNDVIYLALDDNNTLVVKRGTPKDAVKGISIQPAKADIVALGVDELNKELIMNNAESDKNSFTLSFNRDVTEGKTNVFAGVELVAETARGENNNEYVSLRLKDDKKKYIVVDTTLHAGSEAEKQLPVLTYANPAEELEGNAVKRLPESFNFKFAYDPTNNRVLIKSQKYVKKITESKPTSTDFTADGNQAYTYWPIEKDNNTVSDAYIRLVELSSVRELTVASEDAEDNWADPDNLLNGMLTTVTIGKGLMQYVPTTIKTGLYTIQYKSGIEPDAAADNYYIANLKGNFGYAEQAKNQNFDHMPAAQWYVKQNGTIATAPISISNREFSDQTDVTRGSFTNLQAFQANDGSVFFLGGAFANDTLKFTEVTPESKADSLLGYMHVDAEKASVETYVFNYLHGLTKDNGLNTPSDKDSLVRVDETGEKVAFRLIPVVEHDSYGKQLSAAEVKSTGIANLVRNAYYIEAYDNLKFAEDNENRYLTYDKYSKKYVMSKTPTAYFLKENNCADGTEYYALVEANFLKMNLKTLFAKIDGGKEDAMTDASLPFYAPEFAGKSVKDVKSYGQLYNVAEDKDAYLANTVFYPLDKNGQVVVTDKSTVALYAYQSDGDKVVLKRIHKNGEAGKYAYMNMAVKNGIDFAIVEGSKAYASSRVSVDDNTLDLTNAVLGDKFTESEIRVSAFEVAKNDAPLYRRFNGANGEFGTAANAPLNLKFYRYNNEAEYLFENKSADNKYRNEIKDQTISFLGVNNAYQFAENENRSYTMFVDTAYVRNNTRMPQYLIGVRPEVVEGDTILCDASTHQHATPEEALACEHTQIKAGFTRAMYLFNAQDSIAKGNLDYQGKAAYGAQGYTRLAFKDAVHANDTLYILNPGVTTEQLKATDLKDGSLFADKINLGNNNHKSVVFQFRLIDEENNRFLIESEADPEMIAPMNGGWVKVQNGVPVIARMDFNEAIRQAEIFDVTDEIKYEATANDEIAVEGVSVVAGNGQVTIMGAAGKNVTITNILGKVIASQVIASDNATIAVPAGIVAVAVEGEAAVKAIVK